MADWILARRGRLASTILSSALWLCVQIRLQLTALACVILGLQRGRVCGFKANAIAWMPMVALVVAFPWLVHGEFALTQAIYLMTYAVAVIGINILVGTAGQYSLGHAAFLTLGAYFTALLFGGTVATLPVWLALPGGAALTALVGICLGFPAVKTKGPYLALVTLGLMLSVPALLKSTYLEAYTGGSLGIFITPPEPPLFLNFISGPIWRFGLTGSVFILMFTSAYYLLYRTKHGRGLRALRDGEEISAVMGVHASKYKILAFALSAFYGGTAGGLFVINTGFIGSESFTLRDSLEYLVAVTIGGFDSLLGSLIGGAFLAYQSQFTDLMAKWIPNGDQLLWAVFGATVILSVMLIPRGLAGEVKWRVESWLLKKPRRGQSRRVPPAEFTLADIVGREITSLDEVQAGLESCARNGHVVAAWAYFKEMERLSGRPWPLSPLQKVAAISNLSLTIKLRLAFGIRAQAVSSRSASGPSRRAIYELVARSVAPLGNNRLDMLLVNLQWLRRELSEGDSTGIARALRSTAHITSLFEWTQSQAFLNQTAQSLVAGESQPGQMEQVVQLRAQAADHWIKGDFSKCIAACQQALEKNPGNKALEADLNCILIMGLRANGQADLAVQLRHRTGETILRELRDVSQTVAMFTIAELDDRSRRGNLQIHADPQIDFFQSLETTDVPQWLGERVIKAGGAN